MVVRIEFDMSDCLRISDMLGASEDQLPYAMALALNRSADNTRKLLIQSTWPTHVQQRNSSFIAASLTTREARASKTSLAVEIYDRLGRGHLQEQAKGGQRTPRGGSMLAVPVQTLAAQRGSMGVPKRLKPRNLGPKGIRIKDALYVRDTKKRLRLLYVLRAMTRIPKRVPFYEDFANSMLNEMRTNLPYAIATAMATRR